MTCEKTDEVTMDDVRDTQKIIELEKDLELSREEITNLKKIIMNLQQEKMKLQLEIVSLRDDK